MVPVLLATCAAFPAGDEDAPLLDAALAKHGVDARWAVWNDTDTDWDAGLVVLRSTWDYTAQRTDFLRWVHALPRVANSAAAVEWSSDKGYLRDLAAAGVPVVETTFLEPGDAIDIPYSGEVVVKPSIGAGSRGAGRFPAGQHPAAREHVAALHDAGRIALVQPYLAEVDTHGETALVYIEGRFSHAVRKGPMLLSGTTHPVDGRALFIEENITARSASRAELDVGTAALAAVRRQVGSDQLYTRVDLLSTPSGPVVVELELVEPSLFLGHGADDDAAGDPADRLAAAIAGRA